AEKLDELRGFFWLIIGATVDDTIAPAIGLGLDEAGDIGKEWIGNIFNDQANDLGLSCAEAFCQLIGLITHFLDVLKDLFGQTVTNALLLGLAIQDKRNGSD